MFNVALVPKQLELARELVPTTDVIAALVNPDNPNTETEERELEEAARSVRLHVVVVRAKSKEDFDLAFATSVKQGAVAILISYDSVFLSQRSQIVELAARYSLPAVYHWREFVEIGGLMSYGTNLVDAYRQLGVYIGKVFSGAAPADLPVAQPTKFELVINARTAKALGITVPPTLLIAADEVIE
jgi:putative tryptophan/tyrosine transport system substrate-binding protein